MISAEGKSFTAGLDLAEAATLFTDPTAKSRHDFKRVIMRLQESMNVIDRCRKPVIVAIHSHCIGGGVDMASASDIRLASQDAVFSIRESRMAMVADLGTLQRIAAIIGHGWTRELELTGRDFDASQALRIGFLTHVYPDRGSLLEEGFKMASEIAQLSSGHRAGSEGDVELLEELRDGSIGGMIDGKAIRYRERIGRVWTKV